MAPDPEALAAVRAWYRLQRAIAAFGRSIHREHGITGEQLALLRIVAEQDVWELADLRRKLTMHPATLGQAVDRLHRLELLCVSVSAADRRRRTVHVSEKARGVLASVPVVGPVRLRSIAAEEQRLQRLTAAFEDAILLFGLQEWDL